jgi:uncharacterized membrane protein YphA (DoxX/SURF4 family)
MPRWLSIARLLCRLALAGLLLYAAWGKWQLGPPTGAPATMYERYVNAAPAHYGFIAFEVLLATWLASGWRVSLASLSTVCLLGLFSILIIVELRRSAPQDCGCGIRLVIDDPEGIRAALKQGLIWNGMWIVLGLWLWVTTPLQPGGDSPVPAAGEGAR